MNKSKIQACPFCDGFATLIETHKNHFQVQCENAGCVLNLTFLGHQKEEAIRMWNDRAGDRQPVTPETVGVKPNVNDTTNILESMSAETEARGGGCAPASGSAFRCIVADPPWEYRHKVSGENGRGAACHNYATMTMQEIVNLQLPPIADDAFLWLWVTNPVMAEGWHAEIIKAWGFKAQSVLTWVKHGIGMGYTLRSATEHLIVARRGKPVVKDRVVPTWFEAPRLRHSQKPEKAQDIIERICDGPYLELFARRKRHGWASWGNEIASDVEMPNKSSSATPRDGKGGAERK